MFLSTKTAIRRRLGMMRRLAFLILLLSFFLLAPPNLAFTAVDPPYTVDPPYIVWWGNPKEMTYANIAAPGPVEDIEYWQNRGGLVAGHVGIGPSSIGYFDHGMTAQLRERMEKLANMGYKSITLEIERGTDLEDAAVIRDFKAAHPDIFVVAWLIGLDDNHNYAALKDGIDLFQYEVYINYGHSYQSFDDFISLAKTHGILEKSIFALGTSGGVYKVTPSSIENQIKYIRKRAPSMPGIAFCAYTADDISWSRTIDNLAGKYFVDPVLTIKENDIVFSDQRPKPDEVTIIQARVNNIGKTQSATTTVEFFDGNPDLNGTSIGTATFDQIPPNSQATASVNWKALPGIHDIYVKITDASGATIMEPTAHKSMIVSSPWWNSEWRFRIPVTVPAESYDRTDMPIEQLVDFSALLSSMSANESLDLNSIRVVEYSKNGDVVAEVPSQFELDGDHGVAANGRGTVTWMLDGNTSKGLSRHFYIYFDVRGEQNKAPPDYRSDIREDSLTFSNDYYSARLDANRGYLLRELVPAPSGGNVMGSNGWYFDLADDQQWFQQSRSSVANTKTTRGGVYTKFEVNSLFGLGQLKTTYYFYGRGAPIKIKRQWGPAPGIPALTFRSAVEMTSGIPQRGGTWQSGHLETEHSGTLLEDNVKEYYFGGQLGPGYEKSAGWFDWSWPQEQNGGFGVAVKRRWHKTGSFLYDLTRYYDAQDYLQVWQITDVPTTLENPETSEVFLVPHGYQDFLSGAEISPTYKVWKQAHNEGVRLFTVETEASLTDNDDDKAPTPVPAPDPTPEPSPAPDPIPDPAPGPVQVPVPDEPPPADPKPTDKVKPKLRIKVPAYSTNRSKTTSFRISWRGFDKSGIESYSVRYRMNGSRTWRSWKSDTKSTTARFKGAAGRTYYFRVKATDGAGNVGISRIKRTEVPYNENRSVVRRDGFARILGGARSSYYKKTARSSKTKGDSIVYRFRGKGVALVSTLGPRMSKAKIYVDGRYLKTIDTYSKKNNTREIVFSKHWKKTRTHHIKIVNRGTKGRPRLDIDGLAVRK